MPEVMPDIAKKAGALVVATGRSDFPNQINNVLVFPGFFRGLLDFRISKITDEMKIKAAKVLASIVKKPTAEMIIPSVFDRKVSAAVAASLKNFH
jgi:malate dehydrogenase (oxaloacetate-decarboxylating)